MIVNGTLKISDALPVRDIIFQHLAYKYGMDPAKAFKISEIVRKGKAGKLLYEFEDEMNELGVPEWMITSMYQIEYLFPKAHACSYIMMSIRELWYKINTPREFYTMTLNRYGIEKNDNKNFDYVYCYNFIDSRRNFNNFKEQINENEINPTKIKNNQRIAHIIWEMKLRGFKLKKPSFASHPHKFTLDPTDDKSILMPLLSVKGIGEGGASLIQQAYSEYGNDLNSMTAEELSILRLSTGKKCFNVKVLNALVNL